jgi:hypothetical protein
MHLIRTKTGEETLVNELVGHEDDEVLESGCTAPRVAGCVREGGRWRIKDKSEARRQARVARLHDPRVANEIIESLEERLSRLEALVNA